jgi:hypothetical protein
MGAASAAVLILHAVLLAIAPAELMLLADHDHILLGFVTPAQWQEHLLLHLRQARDLLAGIHTPDPSQPASSPQIISVSGCGMSVQSNSTQALAMLPLSPVDLSIGRATGAPIVHPHSIDLSPRLNVPRLPPRYLG